MTKTAGMTGLRGGASLIALAVVALAAGAARAETAAAPALPVAQAARTFSLTIPAKPLLSALADFTAATGVQVIQQSAQGLSGTSAAISGTFTAEQALGRLLSGTGVSHRMTGPSTAVLERVQVPGALTLDPVTVQGQRDGVAGSVDGYVAGRSLSATKTDTPLVETAQSVSVVTREQLDDQGAKTVMQAMRYTPGAFTGQVGASNRYDYVILRGFTDRSIDNVYLDGLKMMGDDSTYSSMQVDPYFLERIEAVKGPASVLYGRSSPGGLIAMTSKKPPFEPYRQVEATIGTRNQRGVGFDLGGPVGEQGRLAYRLVGLADASDTQFDHAKESRYAVAPSLTANLGDDTSLTLQAYIQRDPDGGTHNGAPAEGVLYPRNGRRISRHFFDGEPGREKFDRAQNMVGYQFEHRFDAVWSVRQNVRYLDSSVGIDQIYQVGWAGNTDQLYRYYGGGDESLQAYTIDNQVQAVADTGPAKHTLLAGLDYQHRRAKNDWVFGPAATIDAFAPVYGADAYTPLTTMRATRSLKQTGVYLQDQVALDGWRLSLGGRQDWVETAIHNRMTDHDTGENRQKFTWRAGLLHLFENGVAPYVSTSTSFSPSLYTDAAGAPLAPTEGAQVEAGVKYQPPGSRSLFTAALFRIEQKHVAVQDPATYSYYPVGTIRSQGLELEGHLQLSAGVKLMAGYTLTDTEYKTSPNGKEGNTPPQVPRHMASLWGEYSFADGFFRHLSLGAGVRYIGESWADSVNSRRVPSATVVDASLRYGLDGVGLKGAEVRVNANNLFDKTYVASCLELANCYFGEERTVTATMSYKF